jgi:membrane associated rhomboid family serine protease
MFTLPLYDDNPTRRTPFVTWALIAACVVVFLWQRGLSEREEVVVLYAYGVVPAVLFGISDLPPGIAVLPAWVGLLTSQFLHGGWMHLLGNMLYLWIFGNNIEESMGHARFLLFYLLCGLIAGLTQSVLSPLSQVPMIGASGAIAGVLGAYLVLHPRANVRVLLVIIIFIRLINVPALIVLGLWFLMQFLHGSSGGEGGVATWAHIGGFVAGMVLVLVFRRRGIDVLQPAHSEAFAIRPPTRRGSVPEAGDWRRRR